MKLVELKKFNPPPFIWTLIILIIGWAIKQYVPPEYAQIGMIAWAVILGLASYVGVKRQAVYEVAGGAGIDLPVGAQSAPIVGEAEVLVVRKANNQSAMARTLL